ncbi:hypothetical protein ACFB49_41470 [Sphingomonas sp. DBB INV C78]|uniref:hypothetical protein n=1 Tax=Sphingomonas sp. DBB INV C78 TaxID=3349434 RepID=UPI0036D31606
MAVARCRPAKRGTALARRRRTAKFAARPSAFTPLGPGNCHRIQQAGAPPAVGPCHQSNNDYPPLHPDSSINQTHNHGVPPPVDLPAPVLPPSPASGTSPSRWSGNFYLFARKGGTDALAAGGQLGGGQAGARIAWRLNRAGPTRFALAARIYTPLDDTSGAEAAAGLDFYPLPGQPLRLSVERRFDIGGRGRNAWSAYAAGGFWREVGENIELDGYGQAGLSADIRPTSSPTARCALSIAATLAHRPRCASAWAHGVEPSPALSGSISVHAQPSACR